MRITPIRRALAAGASVAIAAAGLAAFAPAANAAETSLKFNCAASILENQEFGFDADITLPETVEAGQKVNASFTGSVSVNDVVRSTAYAFLNGRFLEGTAAITGKFGADAIQMDAVVPKAAIPAETGAMSLPTNGSGSWTATTVGAQDVTIDGFTAPLVMTNKDGVESPIAVTCVAKAPETVVGTVEVTKASVQATKTTAKVKVNKKAKKAVATVKVVNADKSAAKGKVKLVLKKGKKAVAKRTVKLNKKGVKKVAFKKLKKGKYTLVVKYQGNKVSKKSKRTKKFRVR